MIGFVPNIKYKTELCRYWEEGIPDNIEESSAKRVKAASLHTASRSYAHSKRYELSNQQVILQQQAQFGYQQGKPENYKTIFCKFYAEGQCKLGEQCTYAHERKERRKKKYSYEWTAQQQAAQTYWVNYYQYYGHNYQQLHPYEQLHQAQVPVELTNSSPETAKSEGHSPTTQHKTFIASIGPPSSTEEQSEKPEKLAKSETDHT